MTSVPPSRTAPVLVIGIDPHAVMHPGFDPDGLSTALAAGQARFEAAGIAADLCLVGLPIQGSECGMEAQRVTSRESYEA